MMSSHDKTHKWIRENIEKIQEVVNKLPEAAGYKRAVHNLRSSRDEVRMALGARPGERTAEAARRVRNDADGSCADLQAEIAELSREVEHFKALVSKTAGERDTARRERDEARKNQANASDWAELRVALGLEPEFEQDWRVLVDEVKKLIRLRDRVKELTK